jgi:hypothetical protein
MTVLPIRRLFPQLLLMGQSVEALLRIAVKKRAIEANQLQRWICVTRAYTQIQPMMKPRERRVRTLLSSRLQDSVPDRSPGKCRLHPIAQP